MDSTSLIALKITQVKTLFQDAKLMAEEKADLTDVLTYLSGLEKEFSSVAYEAVAMTFALKDLADNKTLDRWKLFLTTVEDHHSLSIHIGLGWALAQQNHSPLPWFNLLDKIQRYRVLDGMGYYDGMLRHRQRVKNPYTPENISGAALQSYDQGIGRSMWYNYLEAPVKISEAIAKFAPARHADLWRGVGIAVAYVGGFDKKLLDTVFAEAKQFQTQLSSGAALAARTRMQTHTLTQDLELICTTWCNASAEDTMQLTERAFTSAANAENVYQTWITIIEKQSFHLIDELK
ncbi:MAG: uncharacterized protein JWP12_177 [Bacteroidetes bacterium]|nr:uncharacterized protein [Bacteroidota bacterium]